MVLLLIFMCAGSILMGNLLQSFILSDANLDDRTWIWEHYGTAYRCGLAIRDVIIVAANVTTRNIWELYLIMIIKRTVS